MSTKNFNPGLPDYSVIEPGHCQFTDTLQSVTLLDRIQVSPDTYVYTFSLPDIQKPLNLPTCACILASYTPNNSNSNEPIVRPYTPFSTNSMIGQFQLMIKTYPDGKMSQHMKNLPLKSEMHFKHIPVNVKIQYPFFKVEEPRGADNAVCMIVGGTGITPMLQALQALLGDESSEVRINLLYGSRTEADILAKDVLDEWKEFSKGRLNIRYVLSEEDKNKNSKWKGDKGFITKDMIEQSFPSADNGEKVKVFVCGPPVMYDIFCGPREDKENIKGILGELGYTKDQVYKF